VIFVLDTNVLCERLKSNPNSNVEDFLRRLPPENVRISAMTLAEIAQGVENNPIPALQEFLAEVLTLPIAGFGEMEALEWGRITAKGLSRGVRMEARDAIIAATAVTHGWTIATRNTTDFAPLGAKVFDPWKQRL
jgi:predicted nucleic acid-binding protein